MSTFTDAHLHKTTCVDRHKHGNKYYSYGHIYIYRYRYKYTQCKYIHILYMSLLVASNRKFNPIGLNHKGDLLVLKGSVSSIFPPDPKASPLYVVEMVAKTFQISRKSMSF